MGHLQEQAVADDPGDARDPCSELHRAPDRPEVRVEDMVPVVRPERLAALLAQLDLRAEALECRGRVLPAERMDLHGQGRLRAEAAHAREEVPRRRSGAEAEDHARLHVREGGLGRVPLQLVPGGHSQALRRSSSTSFTSSPITRSSSFSPSAFDALDGSPVTPDQYFRGSATTAYRGISFFPGGPLPFTRSGRAVMIREVSPAPAWPSPSGRMPCDA